jgi:ribose transport system permease protein
MNAKKWISKNIWIWSVLGSFILWLVISLITGGFSLNMLLANATLASFLVLLSLGQMTVLTSGNGAIDLSIQYTVALGAYASSVLMVKYGFLIGLLATLLICAIVGILNGIVNMYLKVPAMITTLAVGYIVFAAVLMISSVTTGTPVKEIAFFTQKLRIFGISPIVFIAVLAAVLMNFVLYRTKYGKRVHALGQNKTAAQFAGVRVVRVVIVTFVISSVFAGFTGALLGGYFGGAFQDMGVSFLLTSVAAPVIGGTSVAGGKSSVAGTISGAMMLTLIVACLNLTRLPMSYQNLIQGGLLMVILIASVPKKNR